MSPATAVAMGPGGNYQPDRVVSDMDDPDMGRSPWRTKLQAVVMEQAALKKGRHRDLAR